MSNRFCRLSGSDSLATSSLTALRSRFIDGHASKDLLLSGLLIDGFSFPIAGLMKSCVSFALLCWSLQLLCPPSVTGCNTSTHVASRNLSFAALFLAFWSDGWRGSWYFSCITVEAIRPLVDSSCSWVVVKGSPELRLDPWITCSTLIGLFSYPKTWGSHFALYAEFILMHTGCRGC